MRTARALTVSPSIPACSVPGGGVCSWGVSACLLLGGCLLWGVSAPRGGVCSRGYLLQGGMSAPGGCLLLGVSAPGGCLLLMGCLLQGGVPGPGGVSAPGGCTWSGAPPPRGQTDAYKHITLPQTSFAGGNQVAPRSNQVVMGQRSSANDMPYPYEPDWELVDLHLFTNSWQRLFTWLFKAGLTSDSEAIKYLFISCWYIYRNKDFHKLSHISLLQGQYFCIRNKCLHKLIWG